MDKLRRSRGALTPVLWSLGPESTRKCGDVSGMVRFGSAFAWPLAFPFSRRLSTGRQAYLPVESDVQPSLERSRLNLACFFSRPCCCAEPCRESESNIWACRLGSLGRHPHVPDGYQRFLRLARTVSRYSAVGTRVNCRRGFWSVEKKVFGFLDFVSSEVKVCGWRSPPSVLPDISPSGGEIG
ncbi:hypothetical protein DSM25558_0348 [Agrobacterium sp. DSM 25558]|nr:hypothetical protein DSM25558_0348 [Agrobacterium sp. DSM 25558]